MKSRAGRLVGQLVRWTIAVIGVAWVVSNLHLRDRVLALDERNLPVEHTLTQPAAENASQFEIDTSAGPVWIDRARVVNGPDRKTVLLKGDTSPRPLLGMRLSGDINNHPTATELLVRDPDGSGRFVSPLAVQGGFTLDVPQPRVLQGIGAMVRQANPWLLVMALLVAPLNYLFTTLRWNRLLAGLGVGITMGRTFVLNMVGAFYNTFMPGSTGGDVLKAYYAAKQTADRKTAAVMSVIIDRILGLLALIILGGLVATYQYASSPVKTDPVARSCKHVALFAGASLLATAVGLLLFYLPLTRRVIARIAGKSRVYDKLRKVMDVMHLYRRQSGLIVWAIVITFPVHLCAILSALMAGKAFGLPISAEYYFIVVPVVVLVGAIPISPQGVGVMEGFAYYLTRPQGATLNQALALTMSIRMVAIFWNLVGGIFVLKGGFHAPTESERQEVAEEEADEVGSISTPQPV